jgi:urease accessory protein
MRASAHLAVAPAETESTGCTRITRLRSDPPLVLRPTNLSGSQPLPRWNLLNASVAQVALAAGAAGPVGGDDLRLSIDVASGAALVLRGVSATVALPGPHNEPSRSEVTIRIAANGTLVWLPSLLIAARGCRHQAITRVMLEPGARLLLREELLLGRHAEPPGTIRQRLRVCLGDRPLHDQELALGAGTVGWDGPAVTGGRRALGSVLVVDPAWDDDPATRPDPAADANTACLPLSGPALLITALANDALTLRRRLDAAVAEVDAARSPAPS